MAMPLRLKVPVFRVQDTPRVQEKFHRDGAHASTLISAAD